MTACLDVLLISPPSANPLKEAISRAVGSIPTGLASLGAALVESGFAVQALDLFSAPAPAAAFQATIRSVRPRMVGITAATETYSNALRLATLAKALDPGIIVVLGGPHVTFTFRDTLTHPDVDVVARGEGDFTVVELAAFFLRGWGSLKRITGIAYRDGSAIRCTRTRTLVGNLDELALPARHLFPGTVPNSTITSRGCPGRCIFCAAAAMSGGRYRTRSPANVLDEIFHLRSLGATRLKVLDDTVTADVERLEGLLTLLEELCPGIQWAAESRVDTLSEEHIVRMAGTGCVSLQFGVESGSPGVLARIGKRITLEQVLRTVGSASRHVPHVCCSFVIGHPFDTAATVGETVEFGLRLQREFGAEVLFSISTPYPGTPLYERAEAFGLTNLSRNFDEYSFYNPVFDTAHLSRQQLRNLHFEAVRRLLASLPERVRKVMVSRGELSDAFSLPNRERGS